MQWINLLTENFLKLTHGEIGNMNNSIFILKIEFIVKNLSTKNPPVPDGFTGKFCQTFREVIPLLHKSFLKFKKWECFPTYSMRLA